MRRRPDEIRVSALALALGVLLLLTAAASAQGPAAAFELSRSPAAVVLQYSRDVDMIRDQDPTPLLRIYGDGRYVVHHPRWVKMAGDWEGRIAAAELTALVGSLVAGGLLEFDAGSVEAEIASRARAKRKAAREAGQPVELFAVSDQESTRVRVDLALYKPAGVLGKAGEPLVREIVWWGLRDDARRYPEVGALQALASFEERLLALVEAPGLERLEEGGSGE